MTKDTVTNRPEKFFFDQHIFDEGVELDEDILEEEPPPPVFSESELQAAKDSAFQQGHTQAIEEEKNSRSQFLAETMEAISKDMEALFAQEAERRKLYEQEAVHLSQKIFEKLFPVYAEKAGFDELTSAIQNVIEAQGGKHGVLVRVPSDLSEGVSAFLQKIQSTNPNIQFTVQGDDALQGTNCALSWEDGGAIHNPDTMAEEILAIFKDGLAGEAAKGHDNKDDQPDDTKDAEILLEALKDDDAPDNPLEEKPDE